MVNESRMSETKNGLISRLGNVLSHNLMLAMLAVSLIPLMIMCFSVYHYASTATTAQAASKLSTIRTLKAAQLSNYFQTIHSQVQTFSGNLMVVEAMKELSTTYKTALEQSEVDEKELGEMSNRLRTFYESEFARTYQESIGETPDVEQLIGILGPDSIYHQTQYIADNSHPLGKKLNLDASSKDTDYDRAHAKYHGPLREYANEFGYYDLFLIDHLTGDVVYSVGKEIDFATSLESGPYSETNFAKGYKQAKSANWKDMVAFVDYEHYVPSYGSPASFIASPIYEGREKVGVIVFQMPVDRIDAIINEDAELGSGTESYVIGPDSLLRNNLDELGGGMMVLRVDTSGEGSDADGNVFKTTNRLGEPALASSSEIVVHQSSGVGDREETWTLLTQTPLSEINAPTYSIYRFALTVLGVAALLIMLLSHLISRRFTTQTKRQKHLVDAIGENMMAMASASEELTSVSQQMSAAAEQTTAQVQVVSAASDHVSENTQNVSSGVENFSISVNEVARSASQAAEVANHAVDVAHTADESIQKLGESSKRIDEIVKVITSIAEQTNLLALNATIEAARAGEAGKGFAVVAGEVKELAKETSKATESIRASIEEIRSDTNRAVQAISDITGIVKTISDHENTIASAVEEQTSTTAEISRNLSEAAIGSSQIAQNMNQVAEAANGTAEGASNTQAAAQELARMASTLQRLIEDYRYQ